MPTLAQRPNWRAKKGAVAFTPPLPSWRAVMAVGDWYELTNTAMSSVAPSPTPSGNSGPSSKVSAWTSFVVDTRSSKLYSVAQGGHTDYAGNEVDCLSLNTETPSWAERLAPTPNADLTDCQSYYLDGRPAARHSYYGVTLDTVNDRVMLFGGVFWCSVGGSTYAVSSYQIAGNSYNASATHPDLPVALQGFIGYAAAADPLTGDVYVASNFAYARWNRSSNDWTGLAGSGVYGIETASAMDTARGRIFYLGGVNPDHQLYTISSNTWSSVTLGGANAADVADVAGGALVYVPAIDRFLVRKAAAGAVVYQIDPTTFEVTTFSTSGGATIPITDNGPRNKFLYVSALTGAVYVPSYTGNAWFLRTH